MIDPAPLDPAFADFLADPRVALEPPAEDMTMADYRRRLDRPMAAVSGPSIFAVEDARAVPDVPLRIYRPANDPVSTILFIHGGGFVTGSLDTHDALCRTLASASGADVIAVDYRLAPESPFPAALDDCRAALGWVAKRGGTIALCGDSAGGHLATMTALAAARDGIAINALGLFYPVVSPRCDSSSWQRLGVGHMLTECWMRWAWAAYIGGGDPSKSDLIHTDLRDVPPTHIITAAYDPLRDEGDALARAIRDAGGTATISHYPGMIHGFASLPMLTPSADQAIADMADALLVNVCVD